MKAIFQIMEHFIERGMNVRVDFVGGVPMFSAVSLDRETRDANALHSTSGLLCAKKAQPMPAAH